MTRFNSLNSTTPQIDLHSVDYAILLIYILVVVGIGFVLKKYVKSASDFLTSGRSIPVWVTGLAFLSANLGAQEASSPCSTSRAGM